MTKPASAARTLLLSFVTAAVFLIPYAANAMTCKEFGRALWNAIHDDGDKVALPNLENVAYRRPDGTFVRYSVTGIVGLDGSLRCENHDEFEAFDVGTNIPDDKTEAALRILRLQNLAAAAICAVTIPRPKAHACSTVSLVTAGAVIDAYGVARVRGEVGPAGTKKAILKGGFEANFDAIDGRLSFLLVPPVGRAH